MPPTWMIEELERERSEREERRRARIDVPAPPHRSEPPPEGGEPVPRGVVTIEVL